MTRTYSFSSPTQTFNFKNLSVQGVQVSSSYIILLLSEHLKLAYLLNKSAILVWADGKTTVHCLS